MRFMVYVLMSFYILPVLAFAADPVTIAADRLFVPDGYDQNDEIIVVLDGSLPDTCYQIKKPEFKIDEAHFTIVITPQAWINTGNCVATPVPYSLEVDFGTLKPGIWEVDVVNSNIHRDLKVDPSASASPDDFVYAPVEQARIEFNQPQGRKELILKGHIFANCLDWQAISILDQGEVIVVLPVLKRISEQCESANLAFTKRVNLPTTMSPGRHLVHIRSLNGRALNIVFDN